MPYIPHSEEDIAAMLKTIGVDSIAQLFDEIPAQLKHTEHLSSLPEGLSEMALARLMRARANHNVAGHCFIGAGAYQHYIPAPVWQLAERGEFYTCYTPYQAEASQGTLQLLYEYQSMISGLMAMDVSNASMYDGATALAEAILMAVRSTKRSSKHAAGAAYQVVLPSTVHPAYRAVVKTIVTQHNISLISCDYCPQTGQMQPHAASDLDLNKLAVVVIAQPNFFGALEQVDELTDWAHQQQAKVIALVNPIAMALLKPPGRWGAQGADIVCGEGQPLGIPLSAGGPYFGFLCCKQALVRQMPGRIVGRTHDKNGQEGFTLTLQAREQHIRRAKATSNICTNQGLMVTAATIYMSVLGGKGLCDVALQCHQQTVKLTHMLADLPEVERAFSSGFFHEVVIRFKQPVADIFLGMLEAGYLSGYPLGQSYPELADCLLLCVTEMKTDADCEDYLQALKSVLANVSAERCSELKGADHVNH